MPTEDWVLLMNAKSADETVGTALPCGAADWMIFMAEFSEGVSGGELTFECARQDDFAGTWSELDVVTAADNVAKHIERPGGVGFVRPRISTAITDGTVSVWGKRRYDR